MHQLHRRNGALTAKGGDEVLYEVATTAGPWRTIIRAGNVLRAVRDPRTICARGFGGGGASG
ncbi:hypothetical protein [Nitrobacter sp. JJSN]|uniref:hypothetical protein n=1 Tax=Nitrobacter sp. JJSN TaxID=3453033 RepID=UPI003F758421